VRTWLSPSKLKNQKIWQPQLPFQVISGQLGGYIRGGRIGRILWLLIMWQAWFTTVFEKNQPSDDPDTLLSRFFYDTFYFPPDQGKFSKYLILPLAKDNFTG
jgi:asparagine synthase (glutamine-hydrolysing)